MKWMGREFWTGKRREIQEHGQIVVGGDSVPQEGVKAPGFHSFQWGLDNVTGGQWLLDRVTVHYL